MHRLIHPGCAVGATAMLALLGGLIGCTGSPPDPPAEPGPGEPAPLSDPKPAFAETIECRRPSVAEIEDDPVVQWAMRNALRAAFRGFQKGEKPLEQGGWVYQCRAPNATAGRSRHYLDVALVEGGYRNQIEMDMRDEIYRAHMPERPECRTVGAFHVHTSLGPTAARPSPADRAGATQRGIPSYFVQTPERPVAEPIGELNPQAYGDWAEPGIENLSWTCPCEARAKDSEADAGAACALRGERIFGRVTAEIGAAEPERLAVGPLEWPRDRSAELARAIQTDADLVAHVVAQSLGFGASRQSVEQLAELMEGALRGPMNLVRDRGRSLRGPFFGRREQDIVDRSAVTDHWDGELVRQGVTFSHLASGGGGEIRGDIRSDIRAGTYERSEQVRAFAMRYDGATDGVVRGRSGVSLEGTLGSDGDAVTLHVWGVLVEARRDLTLRMTLRADGSGDAIATAIVVPTVVLEGGALAAFPAGAPGRPGVQTILAASAIQSGAGPAGVGAELERRMAELPPEQRRMLNQALGADPSETIRSMLSHLGNGSGGIPDGRLRLPGPPAGREYVLYYVMTVIQFNLESRSLPERKWAGSGAASVAARLEVNPGENAPAPRLPGLGEVDRVLARVSPRGPVALLPRSEAWSFLAGRW